MDYHGEYFEARSAASHAARLRHDPQGVISIFSENEDVCLVRGLEIESLQDDRLVLFSCGRQFVADQRFDREFIRSYTSRSEHLLKWLEAFSPIRMVVLVTLFVISLILFRMLFHHIGDFVADKFPQSWERQIGENTYSAMLETVLQPSKLPLARQRQLREQTLLLAALANLPQLPEIMFHDAGKIGPNAMVFPGGPVVMTDQLVRLMDNDEQIMAVMAHELIHLQERHSIRQIIQLTGTSVVKMMIFGMDSASLDKISGVAISARGVSNSRDFESQADNGAINLLRQAGYQPQAMIEAVSKLTPRGCLEKTADGRCVATGEMPDWFSTHSFGKDRIELMLERIQAEP